jgi:DNA-binding XRE family transcriptional regulator
MLRPTVTEARECTGPQSTPVKASALSFRILFGLERAALALRHDADLGTSYGFFLARGFLDVLGSWLVLVVVGGLRTGCSAHGGLLGESLYDSNSTPDLPYERGRTMRPVREQHGWSQAQLAATAGMTQSAVARFDAGGTVPSLRVLDRLAQALDAELTVQVTPRAYVA